MKIKTLTLGGFRHPRTPRAAIRVIEYGIETGPEKTVARQNCRQIAPNYSQLASGPPKLTNSLIDPGRCWRDESP
jgi:hypothetical protein